MKQAGRGAQMAFFGEFSQGNVWEVSGGFILGIFPAVNFSSANIRG